MIKKKNPLVSIVVPSYNHGKFIHRALNSLLDQTYDNWEALIVDSYSTDNTKQILKKFSDKRFKYLKNKTVGIVASSRNIGIRHAKGDWVAFLDSDDWWAANKLKVCVENINKNVDFIYHDLKIKHFKFKWLIHRKIRTRQLKKPVLVDLLQTGNIIGNSSVFVRKIFLERIGGLNEDKKFLAAEDYYAWLCIAELTNQFLFIPKILGFYLIHNHNISKRNMSIPSSYAVKKFLDKLKKKQKLKLKVNLKYQSGRFNYLNLNYKKAKNDLFFVFKNGNYYLKFRVYLMIILMSFKKLF